MEISRIYAGKSVTTYIVQFSDNQGKSGHAKETDLL